MGYRRTLQRAISNFIDKTPTITTQDTREVTTSSIVPPTISTSSSSSSSVSNYTSPIRYVRSRNVAFSSVSLRPSTRFYPFFGGIDMSKYIIPKLLEIQMISGPSFIEGETVESLPTYITNYISFRLCSCNHKDGPYISNSSVSSVYSKNPYDGQNMPTNYSSTSTFLNVDTRSLALSSETSFFGSVSIGMKLIGKTSKAVAEVTNLRLISDENGSLLGSFFIPDPRLLANPKFITGQNIFKLVDVNDIRSTPSSSSESVYSASGVLRTNVTETIVTTINTTNNSTNTPSTREEIIVPSYNINTTTVTNVSTTITPTVTISKKQTVKLDQRLDRLTNELENLKNKSNKTNKDKNRIDFLQNEIANVQETLSDTLSVLTPQQVTKTERKLQRLQSRLETLRNKKNKSDDDRDEIDSLIDRIELLTNILTENVIVNS